jgi:hypothetical protein
MPLAGNVRYRFKDLGGGKKQRLAFRGKDGEVVEAVTYGKDGKKTGAEHTPAEFKADRKAATKRRPLRLRGETKA